MPDDRAHVTEMITRSLQESGEYHVEYRLNRTDGTKRWVEGKGRVFYDSRHHPVCMRGICMDVTVRKRAEEERQEFLRREQEARAEAEMMRAKISTILESITDGFAALDGDWRYIYINQKGAELIGKSRGELMGKNMWDVFPETRDTI